MATRREVILKVEADIRTANAELARLTKELEKNNTERLKLNKLRKENGQLTDKQIKQLSVVNAKRKDLNKQLSQHTRDVQNNTKQIRSAIGSNDQLRARLSVLTKQYNALSRAERDNIKTGGQMRKEIRSISDELKKNESAVGDNRRNVGNYTSALGGVGRAMEALKSPFTAVTLLLTAWGAAIKKALAITLEFGNQTAKLQAISGATNEELKTLTSTAKELGSTTEFTATQVAQLQTEYAKLGFTTEQIENATAATLDLATATGEDLAQSATVVGSTIRAFGLDASETQRVVDVMAASFSGSALDLNKFSTAMRQVGPVAKAFNFDVEDTTALLGTLANAGFDASQAGTSLRNILLNLADPSGDLAITLGRTVTNGTELNQAFRELQARGIDLAEALELTDKRSVAAFNRFLEGTGATQQLIDKLQDAEGAAAGMAETVRDTLKGDVDSATSAMEGLALTLGEGLEPAVRALVQAFTAFIGVIQRTFGKEFTEASADIVEFTENISALGKALGLVSEGAKVFESVFSAIAKVVRAGIRVFAPIINQLNDVVRLFGKVKQLVAGTRLTRTGTGLAPPVAPPKARGTITIDPDKLSRAPVSDLPKSSLPPGFLTLEEYEKLEKERKRQEEKARKEREKAAAIAAEKEAERRSKLLTGLETEAKRSIEIRRDLADEIKQIDQEVTQSAESQARARIILSQLEADARNAQLASIAGSLQQAASVFAENTFASKALAISGATISTYLGAAKQLELPFPANLFAVAATIATGLGAVANIAGVQFAEGGLVEGPGTGTSDSIPARLSDGEAVINAKSTAAFLPVLDYINRSHGGAALIPGNKFGFADGGLATAQSRQSAAQVSELSALRRELVNMPAPVVSVKEINKVQNRVSVKQNVGRI